MKRIPLLLAFLLTAVNLTAGQTQSRARRSDDGQPRRTDAAVERGRIIANQASNHLANQRPSVARQVAAPSSGPALGANSQYVNVEGQGATQPSWGNTAIADNSTPNQKLLPAAVSVATNGIAPAGQNGRTRNRLVQQTALVTEEPSVRIIAPPNTYLGRSATPHPVSSTRMPASMAIYRVDVGDVLDIRLTNLPTRESTLFTVLKGGVVEYPLLNGPVAVAGLTTDEIARLITNEIKVIQRPRVVVSVRDYASHSFLVTGLVDNPGRKILRREAMPLYTVLAEALPRPEASLATIVRNGKEESFVLTDEKSMSTLVVTADVIKISGEPTTPKHFVYVGGDVTLPGEKEFRDGMTLTQALLAAGGVAHNANNTVRVSRRNQSGFLVGTEYNLHTITDGKSPDPLLRAGDRIEVTGVVW